MDRDSNRTGQEHILIVTYEININASRKSFRLSDELRTADRFWHYIDSTWIIISTRTAEDWAVRLRRHITDEDNLLVMEVNPIAAEGLLTNAAWQWIARNLRV